VGPKGVIGIISWLVQDNAHVHKSQPKERPVKKKVGGDQKGAELKQCKPVS